MKTAIVKRSNWCRGNKKSGDTALFNPQTNERDVLGFIASSYGIADEILKNETDPADTILNHKIGRDSDFIKTFVDIPEEGKITLNNPTCEAMMYINDFDFQGYRSLGSNAYNATLYLTEKYCKSVLSKEEIDKISDMITQSPPVPDDIAENYRETVLKRLAATLGIDLLFEN